MVITPWLLVSRRYVYRRTSWVKEGVGRQISMLFIDNKDSVDSVDTNI